MPPILLRGASISLKIGTINKGINIYQYLGGV